MDVNNFFSNIFSKIRELNFKDLIIFLIPFTIFIYYLHVFNPGFLAYDSYNQLHQIATNSYNNWHPFFHTFIEMLCLKVYASPVSVCILQILTFSTMWMVICKYFRNDKDKKFNKVFILQILLTLILSLIPINAIYAITLWKDILFSYNMMFLCFLVKVLIDKKGNVGIGFGVIMALFMAFVAHLRPNGIYVIILILVILFVYLFRKNRSNKIHTIIPVVTVIFILLIGSLNVVYHVQDQQRNALMIKSSQILGDYDLYLNLSDKDRKKIYEFISKEDIRQFYSLTFTERLCANANFTAFDNNKFTYLAMISSYSIKNPAHFLEFLFGSSPLVWNVHRDSHYVGLEYDFNYDFKDKKAYYTSAHTNPVTSYDNASFSNRGSHEFNEVSSFGKLTIVNPLLDSLCNNPAVYMYLAFLCMLGIYLISKSKSILFVYLPNFLNILIIMFSISAQDVRFLYSNFLVFYLLVIILISELYKHKFIK